MNPRPENLDTALVGVGIYTPAEASYLTGIQSKKIRRWLRGHNAKDIHYTALWTPQIDIGDGDIYLGFRDLTEVRVVDAFIKAGLSPQRVRRAIEIAREKYGKIRPLSTNAFRTDGKQIFLILADESEGQLVNIFSDQFAIRRIIEPSFKGLEFDEAGDPSKWRLAPGVVLDPEYAFGQPIDEETLVPTKALAEAALAEGSHQQAAKVFDVPLRAVNRAVKFEQSLYPKLVA